MTTNNFAVYLILPDASEKISVWIGSENQTIRDLMEYIGRKFKIEQKFTLNINEIVLPLDESIKIVKPTDVIQVKTETAPYLAFIADIRIKLDLQAYYSLLKTRYGYMSIPPNTKTVADLCNCISELYFIDKKFTLYLKRNKIKLDCLSDLEDEDVVCVTPANFWYSHA